MKSRDGHELLIELNLGQMSRSLKGSICKHIKKQRTHDFFGIFLCVTIVGGSRFGFCFKNSNTPQKQSLIVSIK